jgi:hypothetical protein
VEEWDSVKHQVKPPKKGDIAIKHGFEPSTFRKYVCNNISNRRKIGAKPGKKSIVNENNAQFLIERAIRADRGNDGRTPADIIEDIQQLQPEIGPKQAQNYYSRTFKKRSKGRLKPRAVKAQKTSTRRSNITVAQQYRWFKLYGRALRYLREKNTGVCRLTGKSFGELIDHFIVGGDETCLMADADGDLKILGEVGRKKHERKVADFRASCTMYRTGTPAGSNGPTAFLMKGKQRKAGMTDKFLIKEGCAKGSTIAMTPNAFMTDEAWKEISPKVCVYVIAVLYSFSFTPHLSPTPYLSTMLLPLRLLKVIGACLL